MLQGHAELEDLAKSWFRPRELKQRLLNHRDVVGQKQAHVRKCFCLGLLVLFKPLMGSPSSLSALSVRKYALATLDAVCKSRLNGKRM